MVLGDWLRFCREQQKEADEAAATEAFLRVVTGADLAHVEPSHASGAIAKRQRQRQKTEHKREEEGVTKSNHMVQNVIDRATATKKDQRQ
eukprot:6209789-Pleurochrysis_carterae.AAC.5